MHWGFRVSHLDPKTPRRALLFMGGCQVIVVEGGILARNVLFGHLADVTPSPEIF